MPERQPTAGQLRLIRDLHVDRKLAALTGEQAVPILTESGLLTPERLETASGIRRDDHGVLVGDGRQLAFQLSRTEGIDRDAMDGVYARLADRLGVEFNAPTSYEMADRQIARLKSIVRDQAQTQPQFPRGIEPADRDVVADLQRDGDESERTRASYAPDAIENLPSRPEAVQAGHSASWAPGHQMARQHATSRASTRQLQLFSSLAGMAGVEATPGETTHEVGKQIDAIVESLATQVVEIQAFLQVEPTNTEAMKPWELGPLLKDTKVAAMNELRTLELMADVAEPAKPTSWTEVRNRITELRESQQLGDNSLYRTRIQTAVPLFSDEHAADASAALRPGSMTYAGIGSRRTPAQALNALRATAERLSALGYTMRSGHAPGADTAFEVASHSSEIYLPWQSFENDRPVLGTYIQSQPTEAATQLASRIHPAWDRLDRGPRALHARNVHQILGRDLQTPVDFVVTYTPDGSLDGHGPDTGGTATALRVAYRNNIPVINIKHPEHAAQLARYLHETMPERRLQHCRGWLEHHLPPTQQQLTELRDLEIDDRLSRLLPSQALAAITNTPLRDIANATADFPFQYDEHDRQTGTGLDLISWYAEQPGGKCALDAVYDQLAGHWGITTSAPKTAEMARVKIAQMREGLLGTGSLQSVVSFGSDAGIGVG